MNECLSGGVKSNVYVVYKKLENYYDDNDKTLHCIFFDRELAELCVKERDWLELCIEEHNIY